MRSLLGSPFAAPFQEQIDGWEVWLLRIQDVVDEWLKVRRSVPSIIAVLCSHGGVIDHTQVETNVSSQALLIVLSGQIASFFDRFSENRTQSFRNRFILATFVVTFDYHVEFLAQPHRNIDFLVDVFVFSAKLRGYTSSLCSARKTS